jgi:hypothetical protein
MADPNGYEFKVNEFACIIFNRRSGEPREHGHTEEAVWTAMVQKRHPHRNFLAEKEFFEIEIRLKRIDHVAIFCGEQGAIIWAERMPLSNVREIYGILACAAEWNRKVA